MELVVWGPITHCSCSFLDQSKNTELIRWSDDGKSFIVLDEDEFAKTLIPELFKHNNYASFVRQLNMYGFHKKVGLADNSMRASERKNKSPSEYSHAFFRRGHPELLWAIQKPKTTPTAGTKGKGRPGRGEQDGGDLEDLNDDYIEELQNGVQAPKPRLAIEQGEAPSTQPGAAQLARLIQNELTSIRHQQQIISHQINQLKQEHQQLHNQAATFHEQHSRHENSINAILTFLATVYDRSLRSNDGANIANLFGGGIPHEATQGNVVDVGDYSFDPAGTDDTMQRPFKKQPLLLQAPPLVGGPQAGRASTVSPSAGNSTFDSRQMRNTPQVPVPNNKYQGPGIIEEVHEPGSNAESVFMNQKPQQDIMSVIQNANAISSANGTPSADFPTVLNSLEHAGGSGPLSDSERANMLRMIHNSSNPTGNSNNALISPTPPAMPPNYSAQLANTRAEIDRLARMQAEQDQSVQNLERLLQPLSPSGSIPGIAGDQEVPIPPGLDLDEIFRTSDYFGAADASTLDNKPLNEQSGNYRPEPFDDELFGSVDTNGYNNQEQHTDGQQFTDFNNEGDGSHTGGRVESVGSSEATTPATHFDASAHQAGATGKTEAGEGELSPSRKRKRNL